MLTVAMMVIYDFFYKLIVAPAMVIFLAACMLWLLWYPNSRLRAGLTSALLLAGIVETLLSIFLAMSLGIFIGLITFTAGILARTPLMLKLAKKENKRKPVVKAFAIIFGMFIALSFLIISLRATKIVREEWLATYHGDSVPNITLKGEVVEAAYNREVNIGHSYRIVPLYIILRVSDVLAESSELWENLAAANSYFLRLEYITVYCEKSELPSVKVGQFVEVNGHWTGWLEDSLYSLRLVVLPDVNDSYLKPL